MTPKRPQVLIIGGGLGGPTLALALKKQNISSIVFELRPKSTSRDGGYIALAPNALRMLDSIDLYSKLSKQGYNYEDMEFRSARNLSWIGRIKNGSQKDFGYKALRIQRHYVRQTLLAELEAQGIEVRYNSNCIEIVEDENAISKEGAKSGVSVKFADGHITHGDFVVGTDGIHSRVRNYIDPAGKYEPVYSGLMGIGGSLPKADLPASSQNLYLPCMISGKGNAFAMMPGDHNGSTVGFFATIEEKERSRDEWAKLDQNYLYRTMNERHSDPKAWPDLVRDVCRKGQPSTVSSWPFYEIPALPSYISPSGRVIVAGDSAHAFPPTGGQGAAMAFEDAVTLADALKLAFTASSQTTQLEAVKKWDACRHRRITQVTAFTHRAGDMRRTTPSDLQQIVREWVLWVFFWWSGSGNGMQWLYGYSREDALADMKE